MLNRREITASVCPCARRRSLAGLVAERERESSAASGGSSSGASSSVRMKSHFSQPGGMPEYIGTFKGENIYIRRKKKDQSFLYIYIYI